MRENKTSEYITDKAGETEIYKNNLGLVRSLVSRFLYTGIEYDDLMQIGSLGLLKAIRNFDTARGVMFSTYAVPVILGELKKYLRDDGVLKVSRGIRTNFIKIRAVTEKFRNEQGRDPTVSELSVLTSLCIEDIVEALETASRPLSLDETLSFDGETTLGETIAVDNNDDCTEKLMLYDGLDRLRGEERKLIGLRYFCGKTQQQTALLLGMSQVQVSRKEKKILEKLKGYVSV